VSAASDERSDFDATAEFSSLLAARRGHFRFESGHHGNLWLDLEPLFVRPKPVRPFADRLAEQIAKYHVAAVCGPLSGGALVAEMVAAKLDVEFYFTEAVVGEPSSNGLFPVKYRLPNSLRSLIAGKRVAIANDVINAGSAVRGTFEDIRDCGAEVAVVSTLAVLGNTAAQYFAERNVPLEWLTQLPNDLYLPTDCPLCAAGVPLEDPASINVPGEARCGTE
jgi:orotate phosphoribosyltransferase